MQVSRVTPDAIQTIFAYTGPCPEVNSFLAGAGLAKLSVVWLQHYITSDRNRIADIPLTLSRGGLFLGTFTLIGAAAAGFAEASISSCCEWVFSRGNFSIVTTEKTYACALLGGAIGGWTFVRNVHRQGVYL